VTLGAIFRRTLPAMAATFVAFFVVRFSVQLLVRPRLLDTVSAARTTTLFDATGHVISGSQVDRLLVDACSLTRNNDASDFARCADRLGIHDVVRIHPDSQFWAMQAWEAAIFVALAAALALATYWWLERRSG
jgi:hypothetical protein